MKKMPRTQSVSAWASFIENEDISVVDAINRTNSPSMKRWLRDNAIKIAEAVNEDKKEASATISTTATIVDEAQAVDETEPARGVQI